MILETLKKARAAEFEQDRNKVRPAEFKPVDGTKYDIKFITDLKSKIKPL